MDARPPSTVLDLDRVRAHTLPNGLRVRLLPDRSTPTLSYYTFFQVGSRNERLGTTGISHLFEHMMFNGSARYGPKEFDRVLEARGGHSNAYTSNDVTAYYEDFAAEALEALVFLAHPYRWPVIGWMDDIARITRADCEAFFRTYYAPNNAAIYVVGDLEAEPPLALLERYSGDVPAGPAPAAVAQGEPPQRGERRAKVRYPAQAPAILAGWRGPAATSPDSSALDVLQVCLAVGESSRLKRKLVQELELAVSVSINWGWRIDPGVFVAFVELAPGIAPARAEAILWSEIAKVAERGVSATEVRRAKALLRSSVLHELATHHGVAHALGQAEALLGDWHEAGRALQHYAEAMPRDVRRVAAESLDPTRRCVVVLEPEAHP